MKKISGKVIFEKFIEKEVPNACCDEDARTFLIIEACTEDGGASLIRAAWAKSCNIDAFKLEDFKVSPLHCESINKEFNVRCDRVASAHEENHIHTSEGGARLYW